MLHAFYQKSTKHC